MIKSVISVPTVNSKTQLDCLQENLSSKDDQDQDRHHGKVAESGSNAEQSSIPPRKSSQSGETASRKRSSRRKSGSCDGADGRSVTKSEIVTVTSIDGVTSLPWPKEALQTTVCEPALQFSCCPSFYDHTVKLSKEEAKKHKDLFIVSDLLDDMIDHIEHPGRRRHRASKRSTHDHSFKRHRQKRKPKKSKKEKVDGTEEAAEQHKAEVVNTEEGQETKKKHKKSSKLRHKRGKKSQHTNVSESSGPQAEGKKLTTDGLSQPAGSGEVDNSTSKSPACGPENESKLGQVKTPKKPMKRPMKKKATPTEIPAAGDKTTPVTGPSPSKKVKLAVKKEEKSALDNSVTQGKIKIAFTQSAVKSGVTTSAKSKWDTSSDEESSSRKGAISYRFSDDSDAEKPKPDLEVKSMPAGEPKAAKPSLFGKMQPGGMLKTIEMNNPLPEAKPSVPLAHPNPGPSEVNTNGTPKEARSKSRSYSRSRSRSSSLSYSSDGSHYRRGRRRRGKRRRRSYTRSYSRSRSHSYSSYSRSRSRSYSRSYSRSTSRSRSRYRSSSRSSYSYSSYSYSSRSRSPSPRYTRAVQPKYNSTRAYNLGKRKKFKKNKQFKNQTPHQNPNIQKQLETGRAKAEETVMRLKRQKEEQQELQNRAMASIAAAASSAGITLPTTTSTSIATAKPSLTTLSTSTAGTNSSVSTTTAASNQNGTDLVETFEQASQMVKTPAFLPRTLNPQSREFIGPVRPGVDPESDIPLPIDVSGVSDANESQTPLYEEPKPMEAPNTDDAVYKNLQEQAVKHIMSANNPSPGMDQLQQLAAAQYVPLQMGEGQIVIDPVTGQPVQLTAVPTAHAVHAVQQQQLNAVAAAQTPTVPAEVAMQEEEGKPAPHEAVIRSYADQVIMSNHKALVSQAQPMFTLASMASSVPQAGVPIQTGAMVVNNPAAAAHTQLQLQAQLQQQVQAAQAAQQQLQAAQLQQLQMQAMGWGVHPQLTYAQPGIQQFLAHQQMLQAQSQPQYVQLPNGQLVVAAQQPQILLQRFARPM